jgi:hypothetical protein
MCMKHCGFGSKTGIVEKGGLYKNITKTQVFCYKLIQRLFIQQTTIKHNW